VSGNKFARQLGSLDRVNADDDSFRARLLQAQDAAENNRQSTNPGERSFNSLAPEYAVSENDGYGLLIGGSGEGFYSR